MKAQCTSWTADEDFDGDESLGLRIKEGKEIIAYLPGIGQRDFDNARLIAAAPDLLKALKYINERLSAGAAIGLTADDVYDSFYQEIVRSALKKATGAAA